MVHAIRILECKNGHILPITFDSNECGCHHNGKPCIIITCNECFKESIEKYKDKKEVGKLDSYRLYIPLDEDGMKELNKFLNTPKHRNENL